jgi:perosamine synthetase
VTQSVPFFRPYFPATKRERITAALDNVLASGTLMLGPWKDRFESQFAALCGVEHAVSVNSATTALQICLGYFDAAGGEVLVPAGSFVTDVSAVLFAGATPVLVDMNPATLAFDLDDLERKLTPNTKGIIWVHLTGLISSDYQAIADFARAHDLFLIEDAAHAHGAKADGRAAGSLGDVGVFSFYPTKVVTAGTGGMLTTNDAGLKTYAEEMRVFGKEQASGDIVRLGNDWFLDEIRACVGYHSAEDLQDQLARRRSIAARYDRALANQPGVRLLDVPDRHEPAWYHYPIFLSEQIDSREFATALKNEHGIHTKRIYKPTHREPVFRKFDDGTLGQTETTLDNSLCLPMFVDLTDDEVDFVAGHVVTEARARTGS